MKRIMMGMLIAGAPAILLMPPVLHAQATAAKLYQANCVMCHSADGSGNAPAGKALQAKDLRSSEVQKQSDDDLAAVISKGRNKMPAFGAKFKPEEIKAMVAYIRELVKNRK